MTFSFASTARVCQAEASNPATVPDDTVEPSLRSSHLPSWCTRAA